MCIRDRWLSVVGTRIERCAARARSRCSRSRPVSYTHLDVYKRQAFACAQYGLECEVWQVRTSYDGKPYRKMMIETFGGTIHPSPSELTAAGRAILAEHPDSPGSLGIAISEAVEVAAKDPNAHYALGSVLNLSLIPI